MRYHAQTAELIRRSGRRARDFGHSYVGSAHILLGLADARDGSGMLLRSLGLEPGTVENVTRLLYGSGKPDLPLPQGLTKEAKSILRGAAKEAKAQSQKEIRPAAWQKSRTRTCQTYRNSS